MQARKLHLSKGVMWLALAILGPIEVHAQTTPDTLWIQLNEVTLAGDTMPALRFCPSLDWDTVNVSFYVNVGQSYEVVVFNGDSVDHGFELGVAGWSAVNLPAGESTVVELPELLEGSYRYGLSSERGRVLGAAGVIVAGFDALPHFHWNLGDWEPARMWGVANGGAVDPEAPYVPRQFTVNDRIFPNTLNDPFGHVQIGVGTSCYITIANQGSMDHVLHFHGFHVEVLQASQHPERVGWTKDTMPFLQGEVTVVRLDAFQAGMYPVHNHNLIAVTNAGLYPGGMITHLNIAP
jgi:hypothetical protein